MPSIFAKMFCRSLSLPPYYSPHGPCAFRRWVQVDPERPIKRSLYRLKFQSLLLTRFLMPFCPFWDPSRRPTRIPNRAKSVKAWHRDAFRIRLAFKSDFLSILKLSLPSRLWKIIKIHLVLLCFLDSAPLMISSFRGSMWVPIWLRFPSPNRPKITPKSVSRASYLQLVLAFSKNGFWNDFGDCIFFSREAVFFCRSRAREKKP